MSIRRSAPLVCLLACLNVFFLLVSTAQAEPEWFRGGPYGGTVYSLAIGGQDGNLLLAGTESGIYRSADAGGTWAWCPDAGRTYCPRIIAVDGSDTVFAGSASSPNLLRSTNAGENWEAVSAPFYSYESSMAYDPTSQVLYGGDAVHGLWKSFDGGDHWEQLRTEPVTALAIVPEHPGTLYLGLNGALSRSIDAGGSWQPLTPGVGKVSQILPEKGNPSILLIVGEAGISRSTDGGASWSSPYSSPRTLVPDPHSPGTYYGFVRVTKTLDRTSDYGASWNRVLSVRTYIYAVACSPREPGTIWAGLIYAGMLKTANAGADWTDSSVGLSAVLVNAVFADPNDAAIAYAMTENGLQKTTDGGASWQTLTTPGSSPYQFNHHPTRSDVLYIMSEGSLHLSTDGGATWRASPLPPGGSVFVGVTESSVFLYDGHTLLRSTDEGTSWTDTGIEHGWRVAAAPSDPAIVYCHGLPVQFHRSTDGGETWEQVGDRVPDVASALLVDHVNPSVVMLYASGGVYRSEDGGITWEHTRPHGTSTHHNALFGAALDPAIPDVLYAGFNQFVPGVAVSPPYLGALYRSEDGGRYWHPVQPAWPSETAVTSVAISRNDPSILYVGTVEGVFSISTGYREEVEVALSRAGYAPWAGDEPGSYGLRVTNLGRRATSSEITVTDVLPRGVTPIEADGPNWDCTIAGARITCKSSAPLAPGSDSVIEVQVEVAGRAAPAALLWADVSLAGDANPYNNGAGTRIPVSQVYYVPHVVDGVFGSLGLQTSFYFLNMGEEASEVRVEFFDSSGRPMPVSMGGTVTDVHLAPLAPGRSVRVWTDGDGVLRAGYARISGGPGIRGTAVIRYAAEDRVLSELAVPAVYPQKKTQVLVDSSGGALTGLALLNRGRSPADYTISVYDSDSRLLATATSAQLGGPIPVGGHRARYLAEMVTGLPARLIGFVQVDSDLPLAVLSLRQNGDFSLPAMSLLPAFNLDESESSALLQTFPHFASGRSGLFTVRTRLILQSTGEDELAQLEFFKPDGTAMPVDLEGMGRQSAFAIPLKSGQTIALQATGTDELKVGYARVIGAGIRAAAFLEMSSGESPFLQTGIPIGSDGTQFSLIVDRASGVETGLAIVNQRSVETYVFVKAFTLPDRAATGITFRLEPGQQVAKYLTDLLPALKDAYAGPITVQVTSGHPVSVLVLRQGSPGMPGNEHILTLFPAFAGLASWGW